MKVHAVFPQETTVNENCILLYEYLNPLIVFACTKFNGIIFLVHSTQLYSRPEIFLPYAKFMADLVRDPLLCLCNVQVKQWGSLDNFCSHPRDLQRKESLNRNKDRLSVALCLRFSALHFPARQTCGRPRGSAKADVYCQNSSWAACFVSSPSISSPSSGVLSILCKSSNQHAQIPFNFTPSRVALISSSNLGCILFSLFFLT